MYIFLFIYSYLFISNLNVRNIICNLKDDAYVVSNIVFLFEWQKLLPMIPNLSMGSLRDMPRDGEVFYINITKT